MQRQSNQTLLPSHAQNVPNEGRTKRSVIDDVLRFAESCNEKKDKENVAD